MSIKRDWKFWTGVGFLVSMAAINWTLVYHFFYQEPYLTYRNLPFPPLQETVKAGHIMPVRVVRCNSDSMPRTYTITRSLEPIDSPMPRYYVLESQTIRIKPGCTDETSLANKLPEDVTPGKYRLIGQAEINMGLRTHQVEWTSEPFEVVE
jgi:hypothetical protein